MAAVAVVATGAVEDRFGIRCAFLVGDKFALGYSGPAAENRVAIAVEVGCLSC